jgi:hypothetical protein
MTRFEFEPILPMSSSTASPKTRSIKYRGIAPPLRSLGCVAYPSDHKPHRAGGRADDIHISQLLLEADRSFALTG